MQEDLFHRNIPDRLAHLRELPFAHYIGTTPAGVDWVAYEARNVEPMTERFHLMRMRQTLAKRINKARWV